MRSLLFLPTLVVLVLVSACADEPSAPAPLPPGVNVPATTPDDVNNLLDAAQSLRVYVSPDEIQSIDSKQTADGGDSGWFRKELGWCNTNGYQESFEGRVWNSESSFCNAVGVWLGTETAAEIAFARACVAPIVPGVTNATQTCANLSSLYEQRGELDLALAVVQDAPKCQGTLQTEYWGPREINGTMQNDTGNIELLRCRQQEMSLLAKLHRSVEERAVAQVLCNAQIEEGCRTLQELGSAVDVSRVEQQQAQLGAEYEAASAAVVADRKQAQAQEDESFSEKMQALRSAAGNDPNAMVDAANKAAANMIAIGAANDAARERYREEQQVRQQREEASAARESSETTPAPTTTQTPLAAANSGNGTNGNQNSSDTSGDSCTNMDGYVTAKVWVGSDSIVAGSLTNTSAQAVSVHYTFARGGQPDPNQVGVLTLQPGQTRGGEMSGIEASSSQVDIPPKIFWSAVLASDGDKPCGMRNPWQ